MSAVVVVLLLLLDSPVSHGPKSSSMSKKSVPSTVQTTLTQVRTNLTTQFRQLSNILLSIIVGTILYLTTSSFCTVHCFFIPFDRYNLAAQSADLRLCDGTTLGSCAHTHSGCRPACVPCVGGIADSRRSHS